MEGIIGLDLGGTKLAAALFSGRGDLLHKEVVPLAGREGRGVGALIAGQVRRLLERAGEDRLRVGAVGVSVPGIYRLHAGTVWAPNIPGWEDYALRAELEALLGAGMPVRIDSDRACCILGEAWLGAARGARDAVFLAVGTGIGAGIMVDGRVVRGRGDIAGAIGWLALDRPYRPAYAGCGCFEYHASGAGLAAVARERLARDAAYTGVLRRRDPGSITATDLFEAYAADDPLAREVIEDGIAFWGMAVANLVSLFNPEQIIFGGGVFGPAVRFIDQIREEALRWAQPISMQQVQLAASTLGGDAGLYGAAHLALHAVEG